ncbi:RNA polymerase sigma-70 factor (ECF subfamily) [Paenibacillus rhizosphaerae]|uniref:RNA polymerase sigma factor n=1 Tax=Paenibacillus rhizosphaerae TaxID=297318 RepID=A0A839TR27_9BACL|nr:RNA polymerase sigma factor SigZ [Paenibacillus rhizosphaerae]MBB3129011.1 RNA polymerase sigma-70 factor (ECF subfamily) [Paenibacillus rhizosphaerae]
MQERPTQEKVQEPKKENEAGNSVMTADSAACTNEAAWNASGCSPAITPEKLWDQYHEPIAGFVARRTNRHPDAEDIVQTVFMKAYRHLPELQDPDRLRAWLYQIARNAVADHFRKERRLDELPEQLPSVAEEEDDDFSQEAICGMKGVIPYLPDKYREAVELSELKGMSQKELSQRLGISYSGAKSRVQRGREMVRDLMNSCCTIRTDKYGSIIDYRVNLPKPVVYGRVSKKPSRRNAGSRAEQ